MKIRAMLMFIGGLIGFIFGGSIGIASGGGASNGALACCIIGAIIGFFAGPDVKKLVSKIKK